MSALHPPFEALKRCLEVLKPLAPVARVLGVEVNNAVLATISLWYVLLCFHSDSPMLMLFPSLSSRDILADSDVHITFLLPDLLPGSQLERTQTFIGFDFGRLGRGSPARYVQEIPSAYALPIFPFTFRKLISLDCSDFARHRYLLFVAYHLLVVPCYSDGILQFLEVVDS